jgi:hypothetical protein
VTGKTAEYVYPATLVEFGQVGIEHDLLAADDIDPALDDFSRNGEQGRDVFLSGITGRVNDSALDAL